MFTLSKKQRSQLDDELVQYHRQRAIKYGFAVLFVVCILQICIPLWGSLPAWWMVFGISLAIGVAAVSFAVMEMRADA